MREKLSNFLDANRQTVPCSNPLIRHRFCFDANGDESEKSRLGSDMEEFRISAEYREFRDSITRHYPDGTYECQLQSRLALGRGNASATESGISADHLFGMPLIPGSSLKGMLYREAVERLGLADLFTPERLGSDEIRVSRIRPASPSDLDFALNTMQLLFGDADYGGNVNYVGGWVLSADEDRPWRRDLITPHHGNYHMKEAWPTGFTHPVPVPSVSVRIGTTFALVIDSPVELKPLVDDLLRSSLRFRRLGGKTSSGYGQMKIVSQ